MKEIREGNSVIDTQSHLDYKSGSGFRDAFSKILGSVPQKINKQLVLLKAAWIETPLGPMIAIADEEKLYLLEFFTRRGLEREIERFQQKGFAFIPGNAPPLSSIEEELNDYFAGTLQTFLTPYHVFGTPFQQLVWNQLCKIPYGKTISYAEESTALGKPTAYRAVANANGANHLAIIIPCHRVIASDGTLGGYAGGLSKKEWLINHELIDGVRLD